MVVVEKVPDQRRKTDVTIPRGALGEIGMATDPTDSSAIYQVTRSRVKVPFSSSASYRMCILPETVASVTAVISARSCLAYDTKRFRWVYAGEDSNLARFLWGILRGLAALLESGSPWRAGLREGSRFAFLDKSRNGRRKWCDMKACGNRAKPRRHHARLRGK